MSASTKRNGVAAWVVVAIATSIGSEVHAQRGGQLDSKAVPEANVESLDQAAARMRPEADKAMTDVQAGRCSQRTTQQEALDCLAAAEAVVMQYLTLETNFYLRRAEHRNSDVDNLQGEMARLQSEESSPRRRDVTGTWLKPMAADYNKELASFEARLRKGEQLPLEDRERYQDLTRTAQMFANLDKLEVEMNDIEVQTREHREKALNGYQSLVNEIQVLAGLDSTKSGLFPSQTGLVGMVLRNERQRIRRLFLATDRAKETGVERPLLVVPRASPGSENRAPRDLATTPGSKPSTPPASPSPNQPPTPTPQPGRLRSIEEQYGDCLSRQNPLSVCVAFLQCLQKERPMCEALLKK